MGYGGGAAWSELGRSLSGIGRSIGDRRRMEEEEERRAEQERYRRGLDTEQTARLAEQDRLRAQESADRREEWLIGRGGAAEPVPRVESMPSVTGRIASRDPTPPSLQERDLFPGPSRGIQPPGDFMEVPSFAPSEPTRQMVDDPRYQSVRGGHIERDLGPTPYDVLKDPAFLREKEAQDRGWRDPAPRAPGRDYKNPTYSEALELVQDAHQDVEQPEGAYTISGQQMHEMAQKLAAGEEATWPEKPVPAPGPAEPTAGPSIASQVGAGLRAGMSQVPGLGRLFSGAAPAEPGPRTAAPSSPLDITSRLEGFTGGTGEAWQSNPQAMAMIARINNDTTIDAETKAEKIAGVKAEAERLAAGGR